MNICRLTQGKNLRGVACPLSWGGPVGQAGLVPRQPTTRRRGGTHRLPGTGLHTRPPSSPASLTPTPQDRPLHAELADQQRPQEGQCCCPRSHRRRSWDFTSGLSGPRARAFFSPEASRVNREHPEQGRRCPQATRSGLWPARVLSGPL